MSETLSARLRAATSAAHEDAAGGGFLHSLVRGDYDAIVYASLVAQHRSVYRALERVAAAHEGTFIQGFHTPELNRLSSLEHDLRALGARGTTLPETDAYVAHITAMQDNPIRFLAHHYTRYLGDLSGGIFIGRSLAKLFGEHTTTFYRFAIEDVDAVKRAYRNRIDGLGLAAPDERILIEEALVAYRYNADMYSALQLAAVAS